MKLRFGKKKKSSTVVYSEDCLASSNHSRGSRHSRSRHGSPLLSKKKHIKRSDSGSQQPLLVRRNSYSSESSSSPADNDASLHNLDGGNALTRSRIFHKFADWAFERCDCEGMGQISQHDLYSGVLLMHLRIARYLGPVACYPPPRSVLDSLFNACDADGSGGIDREEFRAIVSIVFAQMTGRIVAYICILLWLVPGLVRRTMEGLNYYIIGNYFENTIERFISMAFMYSLIPLLFYSIDWSVQFAATDHSKNLIAKLSDRYLANKNKQQ